MKRGNLKLGLIYSLAIIGVLLKPVSAGEVNSNCTVSKAWAAELRSYLPVTKKKPVPTTTFFDRLGNKTSLANYRGRSVVLNFWATWCAPCVREMPALDRMKVALAEHGIDVVAVSEDKKDVAHVEEFYKKHNLKHLELFMDRGNVFMRAAKVASLPTTLLINEHGDEVAAVLNEAEWDTPAIIGFVKACIGPAPQ